MLTILCLTFMGVQAGRGGGGWFMGTILLLAMGCGWMWVQSRKIIIGRDGISYRTWRGGYTLEWREIALTGGLLMAQDTVQVLSRTEMEEDEWMGQKYIFLSTDAERPQAQHIRNEPGFLYVQYRPELWQLIQTKVWQAKQAPSYHISSFALPLESVLRDQAN